MLQRIASLSTAGELMLLRKLTGVQQGGYFDEVNGLEMQTQPLLSTETSQAMPSDDQPSLKQLLRGDTEAGQEFYRKVRKGILRQGS